MNQTALITGASVGLGLEFSKLLAADGYRLVLIARDEARLKQVAEEMRIAGASHVSFIAKDLSKPEACREIADKIAAEKVEVDVLINNAGFGVHGNFWEVDISKQLDLVQVNIAALTNMTGLFLPGMIQRGRGKIMNIASVAAFAPGPLMATYYASKAYVLSFSVALAEECRGKGVTVTAVCPGPTRTQFFDRAGILNSGLFNTQWAMMTAPAVARMGYRAMLRGKPIALTGWTNWMMAAFTRFASRPMLARIAGGRNKLRSSR